MPIYAYRCSACGQAKDVLQKMSDPVLTECPFCGQPAFTKQVTAAGFQLKGSGWYVTDFRGDSKSPKAADGAAASEGATPAAQPGGDNGSGGGGGEAKPADASAGKSTPATPAKGGAGVSAPAPAPSAGSSPSAGGGAGSASK